MKGHVLAKRNNISAWCVVVGDPAIRIDQILVPIDVAEYLTIHERVTTLNIKQLQQYIDNGPHAEPFKTGAVWYGRGGVLLSNSTTTTRAFLKFGDVIHRHLKEGDLIIVNKPPLLQKHSLMALHVHMHVGSVFGINPLICGPFGADFDGNSIHVFVPQSTEAMAKVHELLDVPSQLISSQGGQSNSGLTEDSWFGANLMTSSFVFLWQS
jgi:DNA-directed RNA polymerase beta' subunit